MNRRVYLYFALTFLLGSILGGAALYYYGWSTGRWHRGFNPERAVRHLKKELNLSDTQVQQVSQIFGETSQKMRDLQKQVDPQFQALHEETRNRIRQVLSPEQVKKFDDLMRQMDERRRRRGPRPPPPPH